MTWELWLWLVMSEMLWQIITWWLWLGSILVGLFLIYLGLAWWLGGKWPRFRPGDFWWRE